MACEDLAREALEPLAKLPLGAEVYDDVDLVLYQNAGLAITVGDVRRARTAYDAIGAGVEVLPDHVAQHYGDLVLRIVEFFDKDETAGSFLREDGDGGFVGGLYRMAREIDALRDVLHSFPGFTDDASIGDPWIKAKDAVLTNTAGCQMGVGCEERGICYARAAGQPDRCDLLSTHTAGAEPVGKAVARADYLSDAQARELFGLEDDETLDEDRIRVCQGEWVRIPGGYYFDKSAGLLHPETAGEDACDNCTVSVARPVEEPGEVERLTCERDEWKASSAMFEAAAAEGARGVEALEEIDAAWDAFGTRGNRSVLTLAEQVSSLNREVETAEAALAETREALRNAETTLLRYCNEAQAGRYPSDAREFERRVDAAFRSLRAALTGDAQEAGR